MVQVQEEELREGIRFREIPSGPITRTWGYFLLCPPVEWDEGYITIAPLLTDGGQGRCAYRGVDLEPVFAEVALSFDSGLTA